MSSYSAALDMVSVSEFNKGKANKIFRDVKKNGTKLVVKYNKVECALISPKLYEEFMVMLDDYRLMEIANERLIHLQTGKAKLYTEDEAMKRLGINKNKIKTMEINLDDELE